MFTQKESAELIALPKKVVKNKELVDTVDFHLKNGNERYLLVSEEDLDYSFLLDIKQSEKNRLKITLHFQENDAKIPLLRIDYNGQHSNPAEIIDTLPHRFRPYVGKWFNFDEHHIHYYVEGYKPLVWAIPLADDDFPLKDVTDVNDIWKAATAFSDRINLQTKLIYRYVLA